MKIKVCSFLGNTIEVEAEEVKVKGRGNLRFFFHESIGANMIAESFTITEFSTGLSVCKKETKKECMAKLRERLAKYTPEQFIQFSLPKLLEYGIKYPVNS